MVYRELDLAVGESLQVGSVVVTVVDIEGDSLIIRVDRGDSGPTLERLPIGPVATVGGMGGGSRAGNGPAQPR